MLPEAVACSHRRAELEVLVACSRVELTPEDASRLAAALAADLEWEYLLRAASANGILPLLHRHLVAGGAGPVPVEVKAVLRQRLAGSAQACLLLTAALVEALRALADAGLDAVPFKGPLLATALYGDIGLRPFRDVDILVRPRDLPAAVARLGRTGWEVAPGQGPVAGRLRCAWVSDLLLARGGSLLELHWRLTPPFFGISDTLDDLAGELVSAEVAGLAVRTLSPTALLFYLSVHGATHRWPRLEWICDVAELLRRQAPLDWERLRASARANGAERMVGLGVLLASELLGAPLPADLSGLIGRRTVRSLAGAVYHHLPDESADQNVGLRLAPFHLAMRERLRDKSRYVAAVMFAPSPLDLEAVPLPPTLYPLYYLVRPVRLAGTHARRLLAGPNPAPPPP
jgi:hypothetical protein